jgi:hypothetical protein
MLAFFPWLRLPEPLRVGPFHLFPHGVGSDLPAGVPSIAPPEAITEILTAYQLGPATPLRLTSVVQYDDKPIGAELDETDRAEIFRFAQFLAVSGLSDRRFSGALSDNYTASGHYQVVIQSFPVPYRGSINLTYKRKGGSANVGSSPRGSATTVAKALPLEFPHLKSDKDCFCIQCWLGVQFNRRLCNRGRTLMDDERCLSAMRNCWKLHCTFPEYLCALGTPCHRFERRQTRTEVRT